MFRRSWLSLLLIPMAALALSACGDDEGGGGGGGGGGDGAGESRTIAVNMYSRELPYFQDILRGMEQEAEKLGWEVEATFADNDPTQQINQIQNAITTQPDALVVIPIDEEAIVPPIEMAEAADIPVMTLGDNIAEDARDAQLAFLGVNYEELGRQKAELIVDELEGGGTVGWIHGIRGINFSEAQDDGARPVFEAQENLELIDGPYTGAFSSDAGLSATENLLSRERNLDAIYFDNDDIALGGLQAIEERGIANDEIFTVATDGGGPALDAVREGTLDATYSLCGFAQGKQSVNVLEDFLENGEEPEPIIYTETLLFTTDNIGENIEQVESGEC